MPVTFIVCSPSVNGECELLPLFGWESTTEFAWWEFWTLLPESVVTLEGPAK